MASVLDTFLRTYIYPYSTVLFIIFLIVVFSVAGYYGYKRYASPKLNKAKHEDVANANVRDKDMDIYFFHVDWCPHCKTASPEWEKFSKENNGKVVNGSVVNCHDINCTDDNDPEINDMIKQFDIKSYPTIKLIKDSNTVDYEAKVTKDNLDKFIQAV